jgi:hypothetical protein
MPRDPDRFSKERLKIVSISFFDSAEDHGAICSTLSQLVPESLFPSTMIFLEVSFAKTRR